MTLRSLFSFHCFVVYIFHIVSLHCLSLRCMPYCSNDICLQKMIQLHYYYPGNQFTYLFINSSFLNRWACEEIITLFDKNAKLREIQNIVV